MKTLAGFAITALLLGGEGATAKAVYYVDFEQGSDSANGTSSESPWKHAPGDAQAADKARTVQLQPGDEIRFKAGVVYRGSISIPASGSQGAPIAYEGSAWGAGKAILSGLDSMTLDFAPMVGNPKLSVAISPHPIAYSDVVVIDGRPMWLSRFPVGSDPYVLDGDAVEPFDPLEVQGSGTSWDVRNAQLAARLRGLDAGTLPDMVVRLFGYPNLVYTMQAATFDADSGELRLIGKYAPPPARPGQRAFYRLFNNPGFIDGPDRFAVLDQGTKLVAPVSPGPHRVETTAYPNGINVNGRSNVQIDGFAFAGFAGKVDELRAGSAVTALMSAAHPTNIVISNNKISDLADWNGNAAIFVAGCSNVVIRGNVIGPTLGGRGIVTYKIDHLNVAENTISRVGWTGIDVYNVVDGDIASNRIERLEGVHSDGIAAYLANQNVVIRNNQLDEMENPLTLKGDGVLHGPEWMSVSVLNNVVTNARAIGIASWGAELSGVAIKGNIILTTSERIFAIYFGKDAHNVTVSNNAVDGLNVVNALSDASINTNVLFRQFNPQYFTVRPGNEINPRLRLDAVNALSKPGQLPESICGVVDPGKAGLRIGIDYFCPRAKD